MSQTQVGSRRLVWTALALLVLAGLALRVWNLDFDRGMGSHPDERSTACFYATTIGLPSSWDEFWDPTRSPLNPLWDRAQQLPRKFTYGHFPLYLGVAMGKAWAAAAPAAQAMGAPDAVTELMARADRSCDALAVAGRATIALLDTLTIVLVYLLGRRLFGRGAGLLAAAFYAFAAQAIQLSHFFAMDPASTTFTVMAVLGSVVMGQSRRWSGVWLAGVGAGLAIASKFSALPILAAPVTAGLLVMWDQGRTVEDAGRRQLTAVVQVAVSLALAGLTFFVASPYAVLDWTTFVQATLVEQGQMVRGIADMPFTRQYRNTLPYVYFIQQQVRWGLGWPLGLLTLAGTLVMAGQLVRTGVRLVWASVAQKDRTALRPLEIGNVVVWSWIVPYFGLTGAFLAKFNRYMSPLLPFGVIFGAGLVWLIWQAGAQRVAAAAEGDGQAAPSRRWATWLAAMLAAVVLVGAAGWSVAYVNGVYGREHTWITASRWIYANAPEGSTLLWEAWDDPLPKAIAGEPGMDMGAHGLRNIDWSPYEEDTAEKYAILKAKLREADFVVYSSKRIYDSVDELPERYPMTTLYYAAMWDGRLGLELAAEFTSPPRLFGMAFDDRHADESWSLYDHPQVTVFRKVRDLSDAEYDALFDRTWETAIAYYRGKDSPLSPLLEALGLGSAAGSDKRGLVSLLVGWLAGSKGEERHVEAGENSLLLDRPLDELPVVDNYRWNGWASHSAWRAALIWWAAAVLLGWLAWPVGLRVFRPLRDRGYLLSRSLGWLLAAWPVWMAASSGVAANTVVGAWAAVGILGVVGAVFAWYDRAALRETLTGRWGALVADEAVFAVAYVAFLLIRMANPDLWQPWHGGEKFMEFAFLNGVLRSPTFPPVDPHFAGGVINYYYYGLYLVAFMVKLTGIYAEVAFNLTIAFLFALTVGTAFSIAHTLAGDARKGWCAGFGAALVAPVFVAVLGNLDGFAQVVRQLAAAGTGAIESVLPGVTTTAAAVRGATAVAQGTAALPSYDFWGPSRVLPNTINEFPYWSFLFADLHPHLIAMPLAVLFVGCMLALLLGYGELWRGRRGDGVLTLLAFMFIVGTLASVNLWEAPTYVGLGVLALAVAEYRAVGRWRVGRMAAIVLVYAAGAYFLYRPFFAGYVNVGASGVGWVRAGDDPGLWLLVWGLLGFVLVSWLAYSVARRPGPGRQSSAAEQDAALADGDGEFDDMPMPDDEPVLPANLGTVAQVERTPGGQGGPVRLWSLIIRRYDRLPRLLRLHQLLVRRATLGYLVWAAMPVALVLAAVVAWTQERAVLGMCLAALALAAPLLWQRQAQATAGDHLMAVLGATGLAILGGTQLFYLKDFLQGGDWYRMNTLFKFFVQVWVLWGLAAGLALPRLWAASRRAGAGLRLAWRTAVALLLVASSAYLVLGTPARLDQRMVGWRPAFGTLNGFAFMEQGSFTWPDDSNRIELGYDLEAIDWLLAHVRGNVVIVESAQVDYYRAGGTRVASMTGLSGLRGMHESEQRYGEQVGARDGLHREFWETTTEERTLAIMNELDVGLVYVGQLERQQHPDGAAKLERMAAAGWLTAIYANEKVVIYAVAGRLVAAEDGSFVPNPSGSGG